MRTSEPTEWVVYKAAGERNLGGQHAVCSQQEWEALEKSLPGVHALIREHITNEGEAEQLARGLQAVPVVPKVVKPTALALRKQAERLARLAAMQQPVTDDAEASPQPLVTGDDSPPPTAGEVRS